MKRSGKMLLILFVGLLLALVSTLAFARGVLQEGTGENQQQLVQSLRIQAIQELIDKKFDRFQTMPFGPGNDNMHLTGSKTYPDFPDYVVTTGIQVQDDLDILLAKKIQNYKVTHPIYSTITNVSFSDITLSDEEIAQLKNVYLFKDGQDLKDLGYVVSSYRTRLANDTAWRNNNIGISYRNMGNVRVFNPGQEFSFMKEVTPNGNDRKRNFGAGRAIMGGAIVKIGGGGICGAAGGINETIITNKAFEVTDRHNHSITYKSMYNNEIDGKQYWIPGLDAAVYTIPAGTKDFQFKNIREYPVVLVMNFDGKVGSTEEGFVLSHPEDRGELTYLGNKGKCYSREANGVPFKSCYGSVQR